MKIKFTGNPETGPDGKKTDPVQGPVTAFNIVFPQGKWVDVTDESVIARCMNNSHFTCKEEVESKSKAKTPPVVEEEADGDAG